MIRWLKKQITGHDWRRPPDGDPYWRVCQDCGRQEEMLSRTDWVHAAWYLVEYGDERMCHQDS